MSSCWRQISILDHLALEDSAVPAGLGLLPGHETFSFFNCIFLTTRPPVTGEDLAISIFSLLGS